MPVIMIEASPSAYPRGYADLGNKSLTNEEETFYVTVPVKPFLSSPWSDGLFFP
jgi:hypothetical protein